MLVQAGTSIFALWKVILLKKKESEKVHHAYGVKLDIWLGFMMPNERRDIPDLHALSCDWLTDHGKNTAGPAAAKKKRCSFEMNFMPQISWYTFMSLLYIFLIQVALSKMLSCCGLNDLHKSYREAKRQRANVGSERMYAEGDEPARDGRGADVTIGTLDWFLVEGHFYREIKLQGGFWVKIRPPGPVMDWLETR